MTDSRAGLRAVPPRPHPEGGGATSQERQPAAEDDDIDGHTGEQNRSNGPLPALGRTSAHQPDLITERKQCDTNKYGLQPLEPQLAAGTQYGYAKSCQDLRQHSSARREQRGKTWQDLAYPY